MGGWRYFLLSLLSRNLPWARPNWVRKHYAVRGDLSAVVGNIGSECILGDVSSNLPVPG